PASGDKDTWRVRLSVGDLAPFAGTRFTRGPVAIHKTQYLFGMFRNARQPCELRVGLPSVCLDPDDLQRVGVHLLTTLDGAEAADAFDEVFIQCGIAVAASGEDEGTLVEVDNCLALASGRIHAHVAGKAELVERLRLLQGW